ncbi:TonB-dependent receptor [Fulvivirga maritima]|uniref:TonB-dependent receptor domain-containing protein n=1 Tax=Fulvivirga maritima TaxID=2904247 RepID=UPI001F3F1736|nr:TonB-dependent receptor [Fulvivirga maritima]UII24719.1 TonB-dependent receptor [Fulvivirga maritima]
MGYGRAEVQSEQFLPSSGMNHTYYESSGLSLNNYRSYTNSINNSRNFSVEPQLTYTKSLWKGQLTALLGGAWQQRKSEMPIYVTTSGYSSDNMIGVAGTATNVTAFNGSSEYKYASVFARLNYNIMGRYIVNVNFRRDGSSRFGSNNKFGNFGSVAGAWIFTEEDFMQGLSALSFGKLRVSYGEIGSDAIGDYGYAATYSSSTYGNGNTALTTTRIANPNYQWQVRRKFDVAMDLGFFNERVSISPAYYRNVTDNQLINSVLSPQAGFTSFQANLPATVVNHGFEVMLNTTNILKKDFTWETSFNISVNRNELKSFPDIENSSYYNTYEVGRPLSAYYLLHYLGVDENVISQFEDVNGDEMISTYLAASGAGDRVYNGSTAPKYYGGLQNTLKYKGFNLSFLFQFVKQDALKLISSTSSSPGYPYGIVNYQEDEYNDYLAEGHIVSSSYDNTFNNYINSDNMLTDASFIRLKNVNLSYNFNAGLLKKIGLQNASVYVQGQNLLTFTKYKGFDPETRGLALPPLRTVTIGTQLTF